jgi:exonuclease VII large subunit
LVTSVEQVAPGDALRVRVADGTFDAVAGEQSAPSEVERK